MIKLLIVLLVHYCLLTTTFGMGGIPINNEIDPFKSTDQIIKEPTATCEYQGIDAACDQLIVNLYKKDDSIETPTPGDIVGLNEVITIIKSNDGKIVGQIPRLAIIQIEIKSKERLFALKRLLEASPFVGSVSFNMTAEFE